MPNRPRTSIQGTSGRRGRAAESSHSPTRPGALATHGSVSGQESDRTVVHAELGFEDGRVQLGEPNPEYGHVGAPAGDADCCSLAL
ncbi:hypothetical protein GCM10025883_36970 [Mobilicoccus caccae]|uniref:Uncharacterized protein n=1 Tax=Mobilicoccus caccae TaxID=1859295 RepID=A0ABQ6IUT8_9MICO|nr:hypothetical protein GCM10025883_36970 [Mobilicoccus caccae]